MTTDAEKIATIDKMIEIAGRCGNQGDFKVFHWDIDGESKFRVGFTIQNGPGKIEYAQEAKQDLVTAVNEAHIFMTRVLGKLPEFDANKTITYQPSTPLDDEIPF